MGFKLTFLGCDRCCRGSHLEHAEAGPGDVDVGTFCTQGETGLAAALAEHGEREYGFPQPSHSTSKYHFKAEK